MTSSVRQLARALTAFGLALGALVAIAPSANAASVEAVASLERVGGDAAGGFTAGLSLDARTPGAKGYTLLFNFSDTTLGTAPTSGSCLNANGITFAVSSAVNVCNWGTFTDTADSNKVYKKLYIETKANANVARQSVTVAAGLFAHATAGSAGTDGVKLYDYTYSSTAAQSGTMASKASALLTEGTFATCNKWCPGEEWPSGKVGFDPATDTAPTGPIKLVLNATQTEATCIAPTYTIPPSRYIYEFIALGQRIGEPIGTTEGSATVKIPPVTGSFGYKLVCNLTAFANNSAYTAWANAQVGKDPEREGPPKAPGNVKVTAMANSLLLEWDPAVSTGYKVTNYLGVVSPGIRVCITTLSDTSPTRCVINGLNPRTAYKAEVQGLNGMGWGERGTAATSTHPFAVAFNNVARKKLLFGLAGQEVTVTGIAPGVPTGATVQVMHRIGNGTWKTINAKVSRSSAATDRDGSGTFVAKLKLTGKDAKATVDIKATYVDQALIGTPYKAYATSTTAIREVKSA